MYELERQKGEYLLYVSHTSVTNKKGASWPVADSLGVEVACSGHPHQRLSERRRAWRAQGRTPALALTQSSVGLAALRPALPSARPRVLRHPGRRLVGGTLPPPSLNLHRPSRAGHCFPRTRTQYPARPSSFHLGPLLKDLFDPEENILSRSFYGRHLSPSCSLEAPHSLPPQSLMS